MECGQPLKLSVQVCNEGERQARQTIQVYVGAPGGTAHPQLKTFGKVELARWSSSLEEGLCVQCMHIGPYDDEPATVAAMAEYAKAHRYAADFGENRFHHEIYLSDVRRCKPESLKTVVRHPVRKADQA